MVVAFVVGSVLGVVRGLGIAPIFGDLPAIIIELAIILPLLWFVCGFLIRQRHVPAETGARILMGSTAFVLLIGFELVLAFAFGATLDMWLFNFTQPAYLLGLAGQAAFALFPLIRLHLGADKPLAP
jgi:ABC-type amino acid transport system permease subunit